MDVTNPGEYERQLRREANREARRKRESGSIVKPQRTTLRIIGGDMRTRKIEFQTDMHTRPMKDRTREAIFSRLSDEVVDTTAIDLFAGSAILAFESLSRGAARAIAVEKQADRIAEINENAKRLKIDAVISAHHADAFRVSHNPAKFVEAATGGVGSQSPWTFFCCPPYSLWDSDLAEMKRLVTAWLSRCPLGSNVVVELHETTDPQFLWDEPGYEWFHRGYRPAQIAIGSRTSIVEAAAPA